MSLLLGSPDTMEDVQDALAAIQTAFGKQDAFGRWVYAPLTAADLYVEGVGNSWAVQNVTGNTTAVLSYKLSSETSLLLSLRVSNTLLTIVTATTAIYVRLPAMYRSVGGQGSVGWVSDNGTPDSAVITSGGMTDRYVKIQHTGAGNFTGGNLSVVFQLEMDVRL